MQTAQKSHYGLSSQTHYCLPAGSPRRPSGATLAIRFISQRSVNEDYIRTAASQRVAALNDILRPLSAQRATLLPLVGKPCPDIHLTLRKMAASLQTIRSVALVTSGIVYCSSIFGPRQADLHRLQPALPAPRPLLLFSNDSSLLKGSPVLIQWYPAAENGLGRRDAGGEY